MKIVFDIGGSVVCSAGRPDTGYIKKLSNFLLTLRKKRHKIIVVTGAGPATKKYIKQARELGAEEKTLDMIGITGTRMNALFLLSALGKRAYPNVVRSRDGLEHAIETGKITVMGGTIPGQTTDAVAVAAAELFGADLIIIGTDVKGIYDKDPKKNKKAKLLKSITPEKLQNMVKVKKHRAGPMTIMDPVAARLLGKCSIKTIVLDGKGLENMEKAVEGKEFSGTSIQGRGG